jgi:hypothetical protein
MPISLNRRHASVNLIYNQEDPSCDNRPWSFEATVALTGVGRMALQIFRPGSTIEFFLVGYANPGDFYLSKQQLAKTSNPLSK